MFNNRKDPCYREEKLETRCFLAINRAIKNLIVVRFDSVEGAVLWIFAVQKHKNE